MNSKSLALSTELLIMCAGMSTYAISKVTIFLRILRQAGQPTSAAELVEHLPDFMNSMVNLSMCASSPKNARRWCIRLLTSQVCLLLLPS